MRVAVQVLVLALVSASCQRHELKGEASRDLAGTWVLQFIAPDGAYTEIKKVIGVDGHCTSYMTETLSNKVSRSEAQSRVEVKDGYYIETATNGVQTFADRFVVVRMNHQELVTRSEWQETPWVFRRQR
jgi:hypothetical protein